MKTLGGRIAGVGEASTVRLSAGRDVVLQTTTQTPVDADPSSNRTAIDRIATVQGGNVSFEAARDFIAAGAKVDAQNRFSSLHYMATASG